nr:transporter substrate-binding domain-containing protein [Roseospira visakhapatnamensis]
MAVLGLLVVLVLSVGGPAGATSDGASDGAADASPLLSAEQRAWIAANPEIQLGIVSDNAPYSFFRDGTFQGFSVDLVARIEALTGLRIRLRMGNWVQIYSQFTQGHLDAIEAISFTEARARTILFTAPYYLRRTMVFHDKERPLPKGDDPSILDGKRVGVIRDIYYADILAERGLNVVPHNEYRDLVSALAFGWIDAVLAPELTGRFFARETGFFSVDVAGPLPLTDLALEDFRFGVLRSNPMLHGILETALAAIPDAEMSAMVDRWRMVRPGLILMPGPLRLLPQERAFIDERPVIRVGFMPNYAPFSFLRDGQPHGFAVDLARELGDRTGLVIDPVFDVWPRLLDGLRAGDLDVVANMSFTEARADFTLFSRPYHQVPNAVFVRAGLGRFDGPDDLAGRRIGIPRDVFYQDALIDLVGTEAVTMFTRVEDMMRAVSAGEVDMVIASLPQGSALIRRLGLGNVEIGGEFLMDGIEAEDLRFGITPTLPFLRGILDRAMASIPSARWMELETRWLGPRLAQRAADRVRLSAEERAWLEDKGVVRVCGGAAPFPYERIDGDGTHEGVAGDVIRLLAQRGGFDWELVPATSREQALADALAGRCDILPFLMETPKDLPGWTTTDPYLHMPAVVATVLDRPFLRGMASLSGKTVGVARASPLHDALTRRYPEINLVPLESESEGLDRVRDGTLDATIGSLPRLGTLIARHRLSDVKIAGHLPEEHRVVMAVPRDAPLLGSALDRLIAAMGESEAQDILERWVTVRYERAVDTRLVWSIALGAALLIALIVLWNRQLHRLNARLNAANRRLRELSVTDTLTGLPNRAYMDSRMSETFAVCQRNALPFAVAMIDVDHFKTVNDDLGHAFGDACLRQLAEILDVHFRRDGDAVARYGGEEFVTFTAGATVASFHDHLEALRRRVAAHDVVYADITRRVTVSIGCYSVVPQRGQSVRDVLGVADRNLYRAKDGGRDQVVTSQGEATASSPEPETIEAQGIAPQPRPSG